MDPLPHKATTACPHNVAAWLTFSRVAIAAIRTSSLSIQVPANRLVNFFWASVAQRVLPPISKLTPEQVMYHFISGYTAKVAGTEMGVTEPQATFSACFGAPFLVWHPYVYAEMLAAKLEKVGAPAYLVNTGWTGGAYGAGSRMSLKGTRQLIDAIHDGSLDSVQWEEMPIFGLQMPTSAIKDVSLDTLQPLKAWLKNGQSGNKFQETAAGLAKLFNRNFEVYADLCSKAVVDAGPKI